MLSGQQRRRLWRGRRSIGGKVRGNACPGHSAGSGMSLKQRAYASDRFSPRSFDSSQAAYSPLWKMYFAVGKVGTHLPLRSIVFQPVWSIGRYAGGCRTRSRCRRSPGRRRQGRRATATWGSPSVADSPCAYRKLKTAFGECWEGVMPEGCYGPEIVLQNVRS
jgi:hypothetical protein